MRARSLVALVATCAMLIVVARAGGVVAGDHRVNLSLPDDQIAPLVATLPGGESFCAWTTLRPFPPRNANVVLRRIDASGVPTGPEIAVNAPGGDHYLAHLATDVNELVVVFWCARDPVGGRTGMYARWFDATGNPLTLEYALNTPCGTVDMAFSGEFTVAWQAESPDTVHIYARRHDAFAVPQGGDIQVTSEAVSYPVFPSIVQMPGGFAAVWARRVPSRPRPLIEGRIFDAISGPVGDAFAVSDTSMEASHPDIEMTTAGDIIIAWDERPSGTFGTRTKVRRFTTTGVALGSEAVVDNGLGTAHEPALAADLSGGFAVVWMQDFGEPLDSWSIRGRRYDSAGQAGPELPVSPYATPGPWSGGSTYPDATFTAGGALQSVWTRLDQTGVATDGQDVFVITIPVVATPATTPRPRAGVLAAYPNPLYDATTFAWSAADAGETSLYIYDVRGRQVRALVRGHRAAGPHTARWDGRDGEGRDVAAGVYYARLVVGGEAVTRKVVRVK